MSAQRILMYFDSPTEIASSLSALTVCGYPFWRGEKAERLAAAAILLDWIASAPMQTVDTFRSIQWGVFVLDGGLALVFFSIALKSDRFWPLWAAGLQLLELLMHVARGYDRDIRPRDYFVGMEIAGYLVLLSLAVGIWTEAPRGRLAFPLLSGGPWLKPRRHEVENANSKELAASDPP